ncbi:DUF2125 domain-containing protein [Nitratireductor sp. GCM10026969]|uniref:DUF2125 domain-containing protein n=1 Tax=Nitratireductor sp. GCM10026969 TaxID=3252645 RepID=UPI00361E0054
MASSMLSESRSGRRILWLAVAIVVAALAYTGLWFYLARALEERAEATLAALNGGGVRAHCEEPEARGYPFRIGLFCRSVFYENARTGVSFRAGAFRSAAQVYQPFRTVGELDGPATVLLPVGEALEAEWENLRASVRLARPLPERVSLEIRQLALSARDGDGAPLATADDVQLHARQAEADLDLAAAFSGLRLGASLVPGLPALEGRARLTVDNGVTLLAEHTFDPRGRSGTIQQLIVGVTGEAAELSVSGPVSVGADGLIDAELSVRVEEPAAVGRILAEAFPEERQNIMTAAAAFSGLGDTPLQIRIARGRVFAGFIPLGRIPPL